MLVTFDEYPSGTILYNQVAGVLFPNTPHIIEASQGTDSGRLALANSLPDGEFAGGPLVVQFSAPQRTVRLRVGLDRPSPLVKAYLRAYNDIGALVAKGLPIDIGPGPTPINIPMEIATQRPIISRLELWLSGGATQVIDSLEFDSEGPDLWHGVQPYVVFVNPAEETVTGAQYLLEAVTSENLYIWRPREIIWTITNASGTVSGGLTASGTAPDYSIGPVLIGPLALGENSVTLRVADFDGNESTTSKIVRRVKIAGHLRAEDPFVVLRRGSATRVHITLEENFSGSLSGRGDILIEATIGARPAGSGIVRDGLNGTPDVVIDLAPPYTQRLGKTSLSFTAFDTVTGDVIDQLTLPASVIPSEAAGCEGGNVPLYLEIPDDSFDVSKLIEGSRQTFSTDHTAETVELTEASASVGLGTININMTFDVSGRLEYKGLNFLPLTLPFSARISVLIQFSPTLAITRDELILVYALFQVHSEPPPPPTYALLIPGLNYLSLGTWYAEQMISKNLFTSVFKEQFRIKMQNKLNAMIKEALPDTITEALALSFFREVILKPDLAAIGFCLPEAVFLTV